VSDWPQVTLLDVATFSSGGTPSKSRPEFWQGDIPWVSPKDMKTNCIQDTEDRISVEAIRGSATKLVGPNSVLVVVRSGILAHSLPVATVGRKLAFNQDIKAITPKKGFLLPEFIFWMLSARQPEILNIGVKKGATVHSLSNGYLEGLRFALPPPKEQRRIVALLDRAAEIRRRAAAARAKARAILPALFLDTFGDPATNPKRWPIVPLGGVIERITGGKNLLAGSGSSRYRIMKVSAVTSGVLRPEESKPAPDGYEPAPEHLVREGDFLFSRANTRELVGAVGVANKPPEGLLLPDKVWRIEWDHNRIAPAYAYSLLRTSEIRRIFAVIASGTSDSMKNISQAKLSRVPIGVPPVTLQTAFGKQVLRIEELYRSLAATAAKAETMAVALSAEIFG
jgi:type I restriction enzyme, S subunit